MPFPDTPPTHVAIDIFDPAADAAAEDDRLGHALSMLGSLPAFVELPDDEDDDNPMFRALFGPKGANVGELRQGIAALSKSMDDKQLEAQALTQLLDLLGSVDAEDDVPVSVALERANGTAS